MMVGAALVTNAAIATADATDDAFIAQMRALGFTWPEGDDANIIWGAHHICVDRMNGWPPDAIARDMHSVLGERRITFENVAAMVSLAESTYCPG
jgi:Protein of unknown function (DUF732)